MVLQIQYNQNVLSERQEELDNINRFSFMFCFLFDKYLYSFVVEVKDLMITTADTVNAQGEIVGQIKILLFFSININKIDLISTNIETTKKNAEGAQKEIKEANETSKNMRKWFK